MNEKTILPLQSEILYGPVLSRRLGRSLGINILSPYRKICSFDCIYCHYGRTAVLTDHPEKSSLYSSDEILKAVEQRLNLTRHLNAITFSGNGEPTLHPDFKQIVEGVKQLRDRLQPQVKLAIFSNATTLDRHDVRTALGMFDLPVLKLDAGTADLFQRINRPVAGVKIESVIAGLKMVERFILQTVLIEGAPGNITVEALKRWEEIVMEIKPGRVQIYSTDRPVPEDDVQTVSPMRLKQIAEGVQQRMGIPVDAYWAG
jgi:wyosine [tRNA(Phe)-imidazoG37] synthetase (radical SAM superfamily)